MVVIGDVRSIQQCLQGGLLDEIQIHLVPMLIGDGFRLFQHLNHAQIQLECIQVVDAPGLTYLRYRVLEKDSGKSRLFKGEQLVIYTAHY